FVGIMPSRFQVAGADLWMPVSWNSAAEESKAGQNEPRFFWATGILKLGVTSESAAADLSPIASEFARFHPLDYPGPFTVSVNSLSDAVVADFKKPLLLLMAAVGLLLMVSCSNAA